MWQCVCSKSNAVVTLFIAKYSCVKAAAVLQYPSPQSGVQNCKGRSAKSYSASELDRKSASQTAHTQFFEVNQVRIPVTQAKTTQSAADRRLGETFC